VTTTWFEMAVDVASEWSDAVANFLIESGSPGVQCSEGNNGTTLIAYFTSDPPVETLRRFCAAIGCSPAGTPLEIRVRHIGNEDWAENWKKHFQPQRVGERLYICPSWDAMPPPGRTAVVIDPGMAFGTGQHGSTRGCLELIEWATHERRTTRALDVGTGSGVLAVALAKLGVHEVWAVDTDLAACTIAAANAAGNGVRQRLHVCSDLDHVCGQFGIVVANLYADVIVTMATRLAVLLQPGGVLICSGLLTGEERRVRDTFHSRTLHVVRRYEQESWVTLALQGRRP